MRVKGVLAYDGSRFFGFQRQTSTPQTVCGALEKALKSLGINSKISGAGRTDAMVHATGQVVAFDLPEFWTDTQKLKNELNSKLHGRVFFRSLCVSSDDFDPRRHALRRSYRYVMSTKPQNPFLHDFVSVVPRFDRIRFDEALSIFVGTHDFSMFKKHDEGKEGFVRTIFKAKRYGFRGFDVAFFEADGFLRSQIRMMTAFALKVAAGELCIEQLNEQLNGGHRHCTALAPPHGLYLCRVSY